LFHFLAKTKLTKLPAELGSIINLTSLLCHSNQLTHIPDEIGNLVNLKNLDFSNNNLEILPSSMSNLVELTTCNLSGNKLTKLFPLEKLTKLAILELSRNKFTTLPDDIYSPSLEKLAQINASFNEIESLSENISDLPSIKVLNLQNNNLTELPCTLYNCAKLKDLLVKENKIKDNRLKKLIEQNKVKGVNDYLCRIYNTKYVENAQNKKELEKKKAALAAAASPPAEYNLIKVAHFNQENLPSREVLYNESVKDLRPFILCSIIRGLDLSENGNFKKFLTIQVINFNFFFIFII
jgi:Leucine-rich repeat (LRR) protein